MEHLQLTTAAHEVSGGNTHAGHGERLCMLDESQPNVKEKEEKQGKLVRELITVLNG